jgi:membrane associated rhomboid family serine protease
LLGLLGIWLIFALGMNWAGVSGGPFLLLVAEQSAILRGEVWRLATAGLLSDPTSIGHLATTLIGLYFLSPQLEETWGSRRFLRFLGLSATLSYALQALLLAALPAAIAAKLSGPVQFGAVPVVEAVAIAWACSFRGRTVQLFFVLPISSRGLILFVVGISVLSLIAGQTPPSGHLALFAGMGLGWLLGGGSPSPLRRAYLRFRLARLDQEVVSERRARKKRARRSGFRVIEGGQDDDDDGPKILH